MKIIAIVPAAGKGVRMNHYLPKQYLPLGGKAILARTLISLERCSLIDEIIVAVRNGEAEYCRKEIVKRNGLTRVKEIINGGERRQDSVYNALERIQGEVGLVVIHDGVRPFIAEDILMEAIAQATAHKAAAVAVPVTDTIKAAKEHGFIERTIPREHLWAVQTPQIFDYKLILEAHRKAKKENFVATDDAFLVERLGKPVKIVEGSPENIKITTPEDLVMAEAILREFGE